MSVTSTPIWKEILRPVNLWRFRRHLDRHQCGTGDVKSPHYIGGYMNCPKAVTLQSRLPFRDSVASG